MALYDVKCEDCGNEEEVIAKISQLDENGNIRDATCSKCGKANLKKQVSKSTGFELKGKGWFKDGY